MTTEILHVMLGWEVADSVRDALRLEGSDERVVGLRDYLHLGPIDPPDPAVRQAWMQSALRCDCGNDSLRAIETSWAEATAPGVHPVFWVCRSSAGEHAAFLKFVSHMNGRPFDIVDATDLEFTTQDGVQRPWALAMMRPADIVAAGLSRSRRAISASEIHRATQSWAQLRRENAPLRVVRHGTLVSALLTHFDQYLIDEATQDWEVSARLIGRVLTRLWHDVVPPGQSPGNALLFARMLALGESGSLAVVGPGPDMRNYHVRRRAAR